MDVMKRIHENGIVPVAVIEDASHAVPLANALISGGIDCVEITFRTAAAEESIRRISQEVPNMLVGAGTILTPGQLDKAQSAGAKFIVSPGFNPDIVELCQNKGLPIIPGCATPSEMDGAIRHGLKTVKFFPAEAMGGAAVIKSISDALSSLTFLPTGGINQTNMLNYLLLPKVIAVGGSWMIPKDLVKIKNFDAIANLTAAAVNAALGFELRHIGINCGDENRSRSVAQMFCHAFGLKSWELPGISNWAGTAVECMNTADKNRMGHIAIATHNIDRAIAHLEKRGMKMRRDDDWVKRDAAGNITLIYLEADFGGFDVHLSKKM